MSGWLRHFPKAWPRDAYSKKEAAHPRAAAKESNMLNVLNLAPVQQDPLAFVHEGFVEFSAVQANQVLLHAAYEGQRKVSQDHVTVLADLMKKGGWLPKNQIDFASLNDKLILVNGYHRMNAQVASGKTIMWTVVIHPCRSMNEVRALYYKFDTNTRIRGAAQILNGIGFAEQSGVSKIMAKALYNAVPIIAAGFSKAVRDRDILATRITERRLAIAKEYVEAAKRYDACLGRLPVKIGSKFRNAGVTAVALVTLRYQPALAEEFWRGCAGNDGLAKGDPRLALYNDMIARAMNAGSAIQSVFAPAYAWNAYYAGREIKIIKVYARSRASIDGTPFEE